MRTFIHPVIFIHPSARPSIRPYPETGEGNLQRREDWVLDSPPAHIRRSWSKLLCYCSPVSRRGGARVAEKQTKKKLRDKAGDDEEKENQKKKRKRKKNQKKWWTTARRRGAASGLVAPTSPLPYPPSFPLHFSFPFSASHHTSSHHLSNLIEPHLIFSSPVVCRQPVSAWGRQAHAPQILLPSLSVGRPPHQLLLPPPPPDFLQL